MSVATGLTYEDLLSLPDDGKRYELVEGELFVSSAAIPLHQIIVGNLLGELRAHVRRNRLGVVVVAPCDIVFSRSTVLEPDVFFVSTARLHVIGEKNLSGAPDLAVEVLSESSGRLDRDIKFKHYALHGVLEYWLIDPYGKTLQAFRLRGRSYELAQLLSFGDTLTSALFPGFSLPLASLWEVL